jgi:hypothetical protein
MIGDIACYGVAASAEEVGCQLADCSNVTSWARIAALPGAKTPSDLLLMADIDRAVPTRDRPLLALRQAAGEAARRTPAARTGAGRQC